MSGYAGNPEIASEHAFHLAENSIRASRSLLEGPVLTECQDCDEEIDPARVEALRKNGMKCVYCIYCQVNHNKPQIVRMLDNIL